MSEYLHMGGHALYIWPCYAMALVLLAAILGQSLAALKKSRKELKILEGLEAPEQDGARPLERQAS